MDSLLLFDGDCPACSAFVRRLARHDPDRRLRIVPLRSDTGERVLGRLGLPAGYDDSIVVLEPGGWHVQRDAFVALARHARFPLRLMALLRLLPRRVFARLYALAARHRRQVAPHWCALPTPAERARYRLTRDEEHIALAWIPATA